MVTTAAPDALEYFPPEEREAAAAMLEAWGVSRASLFSIIRHIGWAIDEPPRPARVGGGVVATVRYAGPLRWLGWIDASFSPGDHASAFVEQGQWVRSRGLKTLGRMLAAQPFVDPLVLDDAELLEIVREVGRDAGSANVHEVFGTFTELAELLVSVVGSHPLIELRDCFEPPHRDGDRFVFCANFSTVDAMPVADFGRVVLDLRHLTVEATRLCDGWSRMSY